MAGTERIRARTVADETIDCCAMACARSPLTRQSTIWHSRGVGVVTDVRHTGTAFNDHEPTVAAGSSTATVQPTSVGTRRIAPP